MRICIAYDFIFVILSEQFAEGAFDFLDGVQLDLIVVGIDALEVVGGHDDVAEAELLGFADALLDAADGPHFA